MSSRVVNDSLCFSNLRLWKLQDGQWAEGQAGEKVNIPFPVVEQRSGEIVGEELARDCKLGKLSVDMVRAAGTRTGGKYTAEKERITRS